MKDQGTTDSVIVADERQALLQWVMLETTQRCNLRCIHCAVSEENNNGAYAWQDLPTESFYKLLPVLTAHKPWVHLSGHGETFLHPDFWEMLEATIHAGCRVRFQTNGTMLTREHAERIVKLGVELIVISVDAASNELFDKIRRRAKLERILANLAYLQEVKSRAGSSRPLLEFEFVAMRQNIHELPDVIALAAKYGAHLVGVTELAEYALTVGQSLRGDPLMREWADKAEVAAKQHGIELLWAATLPEREVPKDSLPLDVAVPAVPAAVIEAPVVATPAAPPSMRKTCREPWERIFVKHDGKVFPCCYINEAHGDLTVQTFEEAWHDPRYEALRRSLLSSSPRTECANCPAYGWEPIPAAT
jgi:radical SAM protein with 4Fe4S-binding SPASM domain